MTLVERALAAALISAAALTLHAPQAHAQAAEAEALFRDGRALIKQGKLAAGCDKIAASEKLETSVGTLLNLGDCREKLDKLATAWAAFRKAEALAKRTGGDDKRQEEARKRAAALEPALSKLQIDADRRIAGLVVRRDDVALDAAALGTAIPVDAGSYTIVAEAPGYQPWRTTIQVIHRSNRRVVVPALEKIPVAPPIETSAIPHPVTPVAVEAAPAPLPPVTRLVIQHRSRTWSTARGLSAGLAVIGVGAIGGGVYFGLTARNLQRDSDARCPLALCTDPEGLRLNDQAKTDATRANLLYIGGGVAVGTAIVMWMLGKPSDETVVTPAISDRQVGMNVGGRF